MITANGQEPETHTRAIVVAVGIVADELGMDHYELLDVLTGQLGRDFTCSLRDALTKELGDH